MQNDAPPAHPPPERVRAGALFVRLLVLSLVPTLCTAALLLCFAFLPSLTRTYWMAAVFISLAVATLQAVWAGHLARLLAAGRDEPADAEPLADRAPNVALDATVAAIAACVDRMGTGEPPGDAAECVGAFRPVGQSLRALAERFERREADVRQFLLDYAATVARVADSSVASATAIEGAFIDVVGISTRLKELRQSVEAVRRELAGAALGAEAPLEDALPADRARAVGMLELLGTRLDAVMELLSQLAAALEADASARRRTALEGRQLRGAADEARRRAPIPRDPAGTLS